MARDLSSHCVLLFAANGRHPSAQLVHGRSITTLVRAIDADNF